jgi:hypothetical protein
VVKTPGRLQALSFAHSMQSGLESIMICAYLPRRHRDHEPQLPQPLDRLVRAVPM